MKKQQTLTVSVGIPTYEANDSLVTTLKAIYSQTVFQDAVKEVILVVDGNKISRNILRHIKNSKLRIIVRNKRKGQSARINDIFKTAETELVILVNDDVILAQEAIEKIVYTYSQTTPDLITADVKPLNPTTLLQRIIFTGVELTDKLSSSWNNKNNYLSCNGRMIGLSKRLYKKIIVPEKIWNNDAYIYLFSKINKYRVVHVKGATCYYVLPYTLKEHIRQSTKFKVSLQENQTYFNDSIKEYYAIPSHLILRNMIRFFLKNPLKLITYLFVYFITIISQPDRKINTSSFWETDKSTKTI